MQRKLTDTQVADIYARATKGREPQRKIALAYNVSPSTVSAIKNGTSYADVTASAQTIYPARTVPKKATPMAEMAPKPKSFYQAKVMPLIHVRVEGWLIQHIDKERGTVTFSVTRATEDPDVIPAEVFFIGGKARPEGIERLTVVNTGHAELPHGVIIASVKTFYGTRVGLEHTVEAFIISEAS